MARTITEHAAMSFQEIADRLGVSYHTVRTDYFRALRKLERKPQAKEILELAVSKDRQFHVRERSQQYKPFSAMKVLPL